MPLQISERVRAIVRKLAALTEQFARIDRDRGV